MATPRGRPVAATLALWAVGLALLLAVPLLQFGIGGEVVRDLYENWIYNAALVASAALCGWRALARPRERLAWALIGVGLASWVAGNVWWSIFLKDLDPIPVPSPADAGWLMMYPPCYVALVLLVRTRVDVHRAGVWLDGVVAALAVGAVLAAAVFDAVPRGTEGAGISGTLTNVAYPVGDLILLAMTTCVLALTGWRPGRGWALLGAGFAAFTITDSLHLVQSANGTYQPGTVLGIGWPLASWLIAAAAWQAPSPVRVAIPDGWRLMLLPALLTVIGVAVLVTGSLVGVAPLATVLAGGAVLGAVARSVLTVREKLGLLRASRTEALTDHVTGLANRRGLQRDLNELFRSGRAATLIMFDLNGFKAYNDTYGHPAGDVLLERCGRRLAAVLGDRGRAYRMGGDEFCALCWEPGVSPDSAAVELADALSERGEGFSISSAWGACQIPGDAQDVPSALRIADGRMYAMKNGGRASLPRQVSDVALAALGERVPELDDHRRDVRDLAEETGRRLGLELATLELIRLTADLHDLGKVAIPDRILAKPGPLDAEEWAFMHRHTVIGERILSAAPALAPVGRLVRSTHERFDGTGYPDGLRGEEIPLVSRIVFVADAFDAMTTRRPYSQPRSEAEALQELRRCAGAQFDPTVVAAFTDRAPQPLTTIG